MNYTVAESDHLAKLIDTVNRWEKEGYAPVGGLVAVRERISGPVIYYQALYRVSNAPVSVINRGRGRPRKAIP